VGDRAILDVLVRQLRSYGFTDLTLAVGYLAHLVQAVMGDGTNHGVSIDYHQEAEPLGTVGALATIDNLEGDSFLAMNGDLLTTLDYSDFLDLHKESGNLLTIASHQRVVRTDYGVIKLDGEAGRTRRLTGYEEKPEIPFVVSMGVYAFEPRALEFIEPNQRLDLPDLVLKLIAAGEPVGSYLFDGYWLDIGRHDDYEKALIEYEQIKPLLMAEDTVEADRL
jgi:NDP-sugar pyrophosphorylase family protein